MLAAGLFLLLAAMRAEARIEGDWVLADGSAVVRVTGGDTLSVRVVGLLRPRFAVIDGVAAVGSQRRDIHNPERELRERLVLGLEIASGLVADGSGWRGHIYDPSSGRSYRCSIKELDADYLEVRGYLGIPALGRTMYWQRLDSYRGQVTRMLTVIGKAAAAQ
jgi:hypothetical protein